jgi:hypothetical protein
LEAKPFLRGIPMTRHRRLRWIAWPFKIFWHLIATIVRLTGRMLAAVLGAVLMLAGVLVSLTVVGAIIGIPLAVIGLLIILRGLF